MSQTERHPPPWYQKAKEQCNTRDDSDGTAVALRKGLDIIGTAPEPTVFVHDGCCEFKWLRSAVYTFGDDRASLFMVDRDGGFVECTRDELQFE